MANALGCSAGTYSCCAYYGEGSVQIWMDDVACTGTEPELADCAFGYSYYWYYYYSSSGGSDEWGSHNCYHGEDVGVSSTACFVSFL